jgi:hypothetical protein
MSAKHTLEFQNNHGMDFDVHFASVLRIILWFGFEVHLFIQF